MFEGVWGLLLIRVLACHRSAVDRAGQGGQCDWPPGWSPHPEVCGFGFVGSMHGSSAGIYGGRMEKFVGSADAEALKLLAEVLTLWGEVLELLGSADT
eukprot:2811549-Rhodomonas_salina.1